MLNPKKQRWLCRRSACFCAVMSALACAAAVFGQDARSDGKAPLNTRVFRSCLGVNTHFWQNQPLEELDLVEEIGATWIRDEGNWSGEDADPATYDSSWLEKWVNEAHRRGLKVMVHMGTPHEGLKRPDDYAKYAGLMAKRLRGKVQAYHGPNEPYGPFLETFAPDIAHTLDQWTVEGASPWRPWIEKHAELIRKAADAIHASDPDAVMLPEGVDVFRHPSDVFFTHHRWLFEAGLGDHVHGLTVHPYTSMDVEGVGFVGAAPPEVTSMRPPAGLKKDYPYFNEEGRVPLGAALQTLRDEAKQATGRDFDIWVNEWGFPPKYVGDSTRTRGAYLVRMFLVSFANNAFMVGWHNMRDMRDGPCGLVDNQLRKRPSFLAYKTLSHTIGDLYLRKVVHGSPMATKGVQAYLFSNDDQTVLVVWNIDNSERSVRIDGVRSGARVVDVFGEEAAAVTANGVLTFTVDGSPQYIVGVAEAVTVTDQTPSIAIVAPLKRHVTKLETPVEIPAPPLGDTLTVGRKTGRASILASDESLILDSQGLGFVGLNFYDPGNVSLAKGGGNVGAGTSKPSSTLEVSRSQDATTFLTINNPYPKRGPYKANAGTGIKFIGYRNYPGPIEAARIESKYVSGHGSDVAIVGDLRFSTSATWGQVKERMRITYEGDVGIGTTSPAAKLDVNGAAKARRFIHSVVTLDPDDTAPDASSGDVFITSANTRPTALTTLQNATTGQIVRLIGGSDTNSSTVADGGDFRLSAVWTAGLDDVLILFVKADKQYVELGRVDN